MAARDDVLSPVTLVLGEEDLLADRAVARIVDAARGDDPDADVRELTPGSIGSGELAGLTQPSLFGGRRVVVVRSAEELGKDAVTELTEYLSAPDEDVALVLVHAGGKKGSKLLEAARKAGARTVSCPKATKLRERMDFVRAEVHGAGRLITEEGVRSLLDAVGGDLRQLASACGQLVADTPGTIDENAVTRYYRGKAEVSGFTVADRAVEGRAADALEQLRWALETGVPAVLVTSALAQGLRAIAKVGAASQRGHEHGRAQPGGQSRARHGGERGEHSLATELGMPAWKVDRVRHQLRGWTPDGVSQAMRAVAEADAQVKGGGVDAGYALERAVLSIAAARRVR